MLERCERCGKNLGLVGRVHRCGPACATGARRVARQRAKRRGGRRGGVTPARLRLFPLGPLVPVPRLTEEQCGVDPPTLKWSDLRYVFDIQEDCNGKEAIQA